MAFRCSGGRCWGGIVFPSGSETEYPCAGQCQMQSFESQDQETFNLVTASFQSDTDTSQTFPPPAWRFLNNSGSESNLQMGTYDREPDPAGTYSQVKRFEIPYSNIDDGLQVQYQSAIGPATRWEWSKNPVGGFLQCLGNNINFSSGELVSEGSGSVNVFVRYALFDPGSDQSYSMTCEAFENPAGRDTISRTANISLTLPVE